jgi:hypothetical protein
MGVSPVECCCHLACGWLVLFIIVLSFILFSQAVWNTSASLIAESSYTVASFDDHGFYTWWCFRSGLGRAWWTGLDSCFCRENLAVVSIGFCSYLED